MTPLAELLTPALAGALERIAEPEDWPSPDALDAELEHWARRGATLAQLGHSRAGRRLRAAVIELGPAPERTLLAWGYPHPDEPIGAAALVALGRAALAGELGSELAGWRLVLVLCADPDQAARQLWLAGSGSALEFASGCWRPTHLGLEVDYGFPIDWGPFYQPADYAGRCRTLSECAVRCGGPPCLYEDRPYGPLPESLALDAALERFRPELVVSMHNTHTGGDYTFLHRREAAAVLDDLVAIPLACGTGRHRGEPIDRGHRWRRDAPDLIHERDLAWRRRRLERHPQYQPGAAYAGNAAAVAAIEAKGLDAQFVCPETTHFRHRDFDSTAPDVTPVRLRVAVERRPGGIYETERFLERGEWVIAAQKRLDDGTAERDPIESERPASRALLGVRALFRRRRALDAADRIWAEVIGLPGLVDHPYLDERLRIKVPGAYVSDGSMRIFRSRTDYRRPASVAQRADFAWRWPLHTASLLGNMANFLRHQDPERAEIAAALKATSALIEAELAELPAELRSEAPRAPALRSQLARVLRLMLARR